MATTNKFFVGTAKDGTLFIAGCAKLTQPLTQGDALELAVWLAAQLEDKERFAKELISAQRLIRDTAKDRDVVQYSDEQRMLFDVEIKKSEI